MADPIVEPVVPPVVEPVVTPVAAPVVEPVVPAVVPPVIAKPEPSGSEYYDSVQAVLYDKGIDPAKYAAQIMESGKVTPEDRAELVAALGEAQVKLIEQGTVQELGRIKTAQAAEEARVFSGVNLPGYEDGKAAFEAIAEWSKTNVTDAERKTFNTMLAQGGVQADLAVKALKERYMADPTYTVPATLVGGTGIPAVVGVELISRSTYITELGKAERARDRVTADKLRERARHTMATNMDAWRP